MLMARRIIQRTGRAVPNWSVGLVFLIILMAGLVQVGNASGWPFAPGPVPFLLGLLAGLFGSGAILVYLALVRPTDEAAADRGETMTPAA